MVETEIEPDLICQFKDRERNTNRSLHCGPDRPGTISDSLFQLVPYFSIAFLRSWKQIKQFFKNHLAIERKAKQKKRAD